MSAVRARGRGKLKKAIPGKREYNKAACFECGKYYGYDHIYCCMDMKDGKPVKDYNDICEKCVEKFKYTGTTREGLKYNNHGILRQA